MKDTGWVQVLGSRDGDRERTVALSSLDPNAPMRLRITIFCCEENRPENRWRSHVAIDNHEVFRIYAPSLEEAKRLSEIDLREIGKTLVEAFK